MSRNGTRAAVGQRRPVCYIDNMTTRKKKTPAKRAPAKKKTTRKKAAKKPTRKKKAKGKQGPRKRREVPKGMSAEEMADLLESKPPEEKRRFGGPIAASKMTPKKRAAFLEALAESGNVSEACGIAVVSRDCVYRLRKADKEFAAMWETAIEIACDSLELEARRRAKEGWLEPVHWQGIPMSVVRKYSDTLLIFLLKGANPEKYRERFDVAARQRVETEATIIFYPSNGREVGDETETENAK